MSRKRVYIAGPISKGDLADNVNRATEAFVLLAKAGLAPFAPQWSVYASPCQNWLVPKQVVAVGTIEGNARMSHAEWLGLDLAWVEVSDAVLRLFGDSRGADTEVAHAKKHDIPVFYDVNDVIEWASAVPAGEWSTAIPQGWQLAGCDVGNNRKG
jgi:hypothetical protein